MTGWLALLVVCVLLPFAVLSEHDEMAYHEDSNPPNPPAYVYRTTLIIPAPFPEERAEYIEPTEEPMPTPVPLYATPKLTPSIDAAVAECEQRADRYDWQTYALAAGFPPEVVAGDEMARLIHTESTGDLCAVNPSSKAACWAQILSDAGIEQQIAYLDPFECMNAAYTKWKDGGNDFYQHWFQWWVR